MNFSAGHFTLLGSGLVVYPMIRRGVKMGGGCRDNRFLTQYGKVIIVAVLRSATGDRRQDRTTGTEVTERVALLALMSPGLLRRFDCSVLSFDELSTAAAASQVASF